MNYLTTYMICRLTLSLLALLVISAIATNAEQVSELTQKADGWLIFLAGCMAHSMESGKE